MATVREGTLDVSRPRYPWASWTDGRVWEIKRGTDFDCDPGTMRTMIYQRSYVARNGMKARVRKIDADTLVFQFFFEGDEDADVALE